jgi:aryl-alcohol dehydrogenase-like predicted oxidoreductase
MRHHQLGSLDLEVSEISLGSWLTFSGLEAVERLRPIAERAGLSMAELALAWVLRRPELASAIIGASRPDQVHANAKASDIELTPDALAAIDEALGDAPGTEPTLAPGARARVGHR